MAAAQQLRDALARKQGRTTEPKTVAHTPAKQAPSIQLNIGTALLLAFAIEEAYRTAEQSNQAITGDEFAGLVEAYGEPAVTHGIAIRGVYHASRIEAITANLADHIATNAAAFTIAKEAAENVAAFTRALHEAGLAASSQPTTGEADAARLLLTLRDEAPADALAEALAQIQAANDASRTREFLRAIQRRLAA